MDRVIGRINQGPGPKLIAVGGVHGSEPAGVHACERVLAKLAELPTKLHGAFECFRGNIHALKKGIRYIDRDLNRMWDNETVEASLRGSEAPGFAIEFEEMRDLARHIREAIDSARGEIIFFDLHSTSSETIPFFWLLPGGEREMVTRYGMPTVHDPELTVSGTLGQWVAEQGHRVMLAEGGRHDDPSAVDHCEAMLWISLVEAGLLDRADAGEQYERSLQLLRDACGETRGFYNIVYHHKITTDDKFVMRPGYESFQPIEQGEHLADDARGEVRAPKGGRILMPLYKPPCDDGFLVVQEDAQGPHF